MKLYGVLRLLFIFAALTASASPLVAQHTDDGTVVAWNNLATKTATGNNARGLLMVRALAIMHTAMYDAWAQYDGAAVPTQGGFHPASPSRAHNHE